MKKSKKKSDVCWACKKPRPKLDKRVGRYPCFYCADVKLPERTR